MPRAAAAVLLLLCSSIFVHLAAAASKPSDGIVLVGLSNRQCNAASGLNLGGSSTLVAGDKNLVDGPGACCAACKLRPDCSVWTFCSAPQGCDAGGRYRECALKQDWSVQQSRRVISNGPGWVSGYITGRCPGTDPTKLLSLQRINFPSLASQCQPGSSCTACMCQLSKAMTLAKSDPNDLSLCMNNFRTVMMFPSELGGSSLSTAAFQRLTLCPVADSPCADQKSAVVFGTLGPALVPGNQGTTLSCLSKKKELDCAQACLATSSCDGFIYTLAPSTRCCLVSGPSWGDAKLSAEGSQMYYRMPAGTTAEDNFFTQRTPWGGGMPATLAPAVASGSSSGTSAGPQITAAAPTVPSAAACNQTACADVQPPGGWTCAQQSKWGKCSESWMAPYCEATCNRCPCSSSTSDPTATSTGATPEAAPASQSASPSPSPVPSASLFDSFFPKPSALPSSSPSPAQEEASCTCSDVQPGRYSCSDEARWGKCGARYMKATAAVPEGYCQISCKRCSCPRVTRCACTDLQPSKGTTCSQHAGWGNCGKEWMWREYDDRPHGYCEVTCGRCKC